MREFLFGYGEAPQVFEWQIDSRFCVIDGYVLPEVCQLQSGAGVVGKLLALAVAIAAKIENQMAYRIR